MQMLKRPMIIGIIRSKEMHCLKVLKKDQTLSHHMPVACSGIGCLLHFIAFMAFMAFIAAMAFIAFFFLITFMAFMAFMAAMAFIAFIAFFFFITFMASH